MPEYEYTAFSFAPVQGFIEKSRKLRDLYGASLILSYLSHQLVKKAEDLKLDVISPGLLNVQKGMPNRILVRGKFERQDVEKTLLCEWQKVLETCRIWVEDNLGIPKEQYCWAQSEEEKGKHKGEWERWGSHTWEVFWGYGESIPAAMKDLERRKLKRDWTGINWSGESSSLSGTDAIAWHKLGKFNREPGLPLNETEKQELKRFYRQLAWVLDEPNTRNHKARKQRGEFIPSDKKLEEHFKPKNEDNSGKKKKSGGKFIAPNERLSIPELVKRLVTLPYLAKQIDMEELDEGFKDVVRDPGYWTGWFMGDGDEVGKKLIDLASGTHPENDLKIFTHEMRYWGQHFENKNSCLGGKERVIYAGGDDFFGVLYSEEEEHKKNPEPLKPIDVIKWLFKLEGRWNNLQKTLEEELCLNFTFSVGFVWAAHNVPQRDILQHCREAEKRAKKLGRNRVTIRVVFNSGQFVQWTCPWDYLHVLKNYRDRDDKSWEENPNWTHLYTDWAHLKARHAIQLNKIENIKYTKEPALTLFNLYFNNAGKTFTQERLWCKLAGDNTDVAIVNWINDLIQVGWQLCQTNSSNI
ncbi:MAG: type III-B CRISPR-associated protein Cas10/Cmr2 [Cyanobacteriota bacterium]|nr:type III-B CRISPR-associated protein Cas10/Cmr2 [Cyanobacteriota bacterium]